jgi:hypothetical protein
MSLAILKRKANTRIQKGNARADPPGSNTTNKNANHLFNKVSHNNQFSINGTIRNNHYIGRGSHLNTSFKPCESQTSTIKKSVLSNRTARSRALATRASYNISQPDDNFPENDSQGLYIFNKKFKNNCVNHSTSTTTRCGHHGSQDVVQHFPDCSQISGQKCSSFIGTRVNPQNFIHKDYGVAQSYDEYLSKRLLPPCTNVVNDYKKINNNGITNMRCGRH